MQSGMSTVEYIALPGAKPGCHKFANFRIPPSALYGKVCQRPAAAAAAGVANWLKFRPQNSKACDKIKCEQPDKVYAKR